MMNKVLCILNTALAQLINIVQGRQMKYMFVYQNRSLRT